VYYEAKEDRQLASGSERRQRTKLLSVRLTKDELVKLKSLAEKAGTSAPAFLRAAAFERHVPHVPRRQPVSEADLSRILDQCKHVGSDINEIAKRLNSGRNVDPGEIRSALAAWLNLSNTMLAALAVSTDGSATHDPQGPQPRGS
jgi:hypothetical protein